MIAILCEHSPHTGRPLYGIRPYSVTKDAIGEETVLIHTVTRYYQPFLPKVIKHLQNKHPGLLFSKELHRQEMPPNFLFYQRIRQILPLIQSKQRVAVLCAGKDEKLPELMKMISSFVRAVSLVCEDESFFEKVSEQALSESGLSMNRRSLSELGHTDLALLLSGSFDLSHFRCSCLVNLSPKNLPVPVPELVAVTNPQVDSFLRRYPHLELNPTFLISQNAPITNLIWKN